jgi:CheY-like chemotaxis protein
MTNIVLDIGNCNPDHSALKKMLESHYDVRVLRAHGLNDALDVLGEHSVNLILVNRKLDADYSDGTEVLKSLKQMDAHAQIPVMIITNYAEHQEAAVGLGAEYGFGKLQYKDAATHERLSQFLGKALAS